MRLLRAFLLLLVLGFAPRVDAVDFMRGDSNGDGGYNIADAIYTLSYLFIDGAAPPCLDAADVNDDGVIDLADPVFLLSTLKPVGQPLIVPEPFNVCGEDPTIDGLTCDLYTPCP